MIPFSLLKIIVCPVVGTSLLYQCFHLSCYAAVLLKFIYYAQVQKIVVRVLYYAIYVQVYKSNYTQSATCMQAFLGRLFY